MATSHFRWALPFAALAWVQCISDQSQAPTGHLAVQVAPLALSGITNAEYTLTATNGPNGAGETVWTRSLSSTQYGDGAGSLSYVGPCDASAGTHTITLTLTALYDAAGLVPVDTYMNPTPISREVTCVENADVPVVFDITLARQADQGFFDVSVQFQDIFCSAKLDCQEADGTDLDLLHAPGGDRDMTVVMGFACTGSPTGSTYLYMDDLVIDCAGQLSDVRVSPVGQGLVTPTANPGGYLFGAGVYRGLEAVSGMAYWNVSLGLDATTFGTNGACTLRTRATASSEPFPQLAQGFPLPEGAVYPVIDWQVQLSSAAGRTCTTHAVNGGDGVATNYLGYLPLLNGFTWALEAIYLQHRFEPATGIVLSAGAPICKPACAHGTCVSGTPANTCDCGTTGYTGATCATPVCSAPCVNGGTCSAPDTCTCPAGYTGPTCAVDIDECATGNGGCAQTCTNTVGGFTCSCASGYTLALDGLACDDIDECATDNGGCGPASAWTCTNNVGAPPTCTSRDECAAGTHNCSPDAVCTDTEGGFTCACNPGYAGTGVVCTACPPGEVQPSAGQATCVACGPGTYDDGDETCATCATCPSGTWTSTLCSPTSNASCTTCSDVNLCTVAETCTSASDSVCATCPAGYTQLSPGAPCTDIDECANNNGGCGPASAWSCQNTPGGRTCTDIDECLEGTDTCDDQATCSNTVGGFTCTCDTGTLDASGDGTVCGFATSCRTLHMAQPTLPSGNYLIDPDGSGSVAAFTAYCDMSTDGGGWTFVATITNNGDAANVGSWLHTSPTPNAWESPSLTFGATVPNPAANADYRGAAFHTLGANELMITHRNQFLLRTNASCLGGQALHARFAGLGWTCGGSAALTGPASCANACTLAASTPRTGDTALLNGTARNYLYFKAGEANGVQDTNKDRAYLSTDYRANVDWPVGLGGFCSGASCSPRTGEADVNDYADAILPTAGTEFYGLWVREAVRRRSCREILEAGESTGSGLYTIDPDGAAGEPAFQVYCDMSTDGGGWTLIANLTNTGDGVDQGSWRPGSPVPNAWESASLTFGAANPALNADHRSAAFHLLKANELMVTHRNLFLLRTDNQCLAGKSLQARFAGLGWTCGASAALSSGEACANACAIASSTTRAGDTALLAGAARTHLFLKAGEADGAQDGNKDRAYLSTSYRTNVDEPVGLGAACSGASCSPRAGEADVNDKSDGITPTAGTEYYGLWVRESRLSSCKAIRDAGLSTGDGVYFIDPDGAGALTAMAVTCDMTADGGGWTEVLSDVGDTAVTHTFSAGARAVTGTQLRATTASGTTRIHAFYTGLSSLGSAFAQSWIATGFETDNYKPLAAYAGTRATTLYVFADHDILQGGAQLSYAGTPYGLLSYGYSETSSFGDAGTSSHDSYPTLTVQRLWIR